MKVKKLDDRLNILIESDVKEKIEKILESEGSSISDYVRECIRKKIARSNKINKAE